MSIPKPQLHILPSAITAFNIGHLLDERGLSALCATSRQYRDLFKMTTILASRKKAWELLHLVLNINDENKEKILKILSTPESDNTQSIILIRVTGKEVYNKVEYTQRFVPVTVTVIENVFYFNEDQHEGDGKKIEIACKNVRHLVSPLEAAAYSGDFHLIKILLDKIPYLQKHHAIQQLEAVKASVSNKDDPTSYLWGLPQLRLAYKAYLAPLDALIKANNSGEIYRLWELIGDAQKNLPWFQLQVFCHPIPHDPIPDFTIEPIRTCRVWDNSDLDIDSLGSDSCNALYKGGALRARRGGVYRAAVRVRVDRRSPRVPARPHIDLLAIDSLCKVLNDELDKIIQSARAVAGKSATPDVDSPAVSLSRYKRRVHKASSAYLAGESTIIEGKRPTM